MSLVYVQDSADTRKTMAKAPFLLPGGRASDVSGNLHPTKDTTAVLAHTKYVNVPSAHYKKMQIIAARFVSSRLVTNLSGNEQKGIRR